MMIRDMDIAAELIGINLLKAKLYAFAVSSYVVGVAGALFVFLWRGAAEPNLFDIDLSFRVLFIAIIGGLGSILGNYLGAILIVALPVILNTVPEALGLDVKSATVEHINVMIVGALIIFFLMSLAMGVFVLVIAQLFVKFYPNAIVPSFGLIFVAMLIGMAVYKMKLPLGPLVVTSQPGTARSNRNGETKPAGSRRTVRSGSMSFSLAATAMIARAWGANQLRKAEMVKMEPMDGVVRIEFIIPARGLIGFRTEFIDRRPDLFFGCPRNSFQFGNINAQQS